MSASTQANPHETASSRTPPTVGKPKPDPLYTWFTTCPTDWLALLVKGEDLVNIVHSVIGYYADDNFEFQKENPNDPEKQNVVSLIRALTGREFVGIQPLHITGLYRYKSNWNKFRTKQQGEDNIPVQVVQEHGEEIITFTPFVHQYPLVFPGVEVLGTDMEGNGEKPLIPITFIITIRVRMLRPRVALMQNVEWLGNVVTPEIRQFLKSWAPNYSYDELFGGRSKDSASQTTGQKATTETRRNISREFREFFLGTPLSSDKTKIERSAARCKILAQAGVDLISIDVVDIVPNEEFEKALLEKATAYIKAEAGVITANGKRREREYEGQGEESFNAAVGRGKKSALEAIAEAIGRDKMNDFIKWDSLGNSKITTYAEGGSKIAGIIVGADGKPTT